MESTADVPRSPYAAMFDRIPMAARRGWHLNHETRGFWPSQEMMDAVAAIFCGEADGACVIGLPDLGRGTLYPVGVYARDSDRRGRLMGAGARLSWPVGERGARVLEDGNTRVEQPAAMPPYPDAQPWPIVLDGLGPHALMLAAIPYHGANIGVVSVLRPLPGPKYTRQDRRTAEKIAAVLGLALDELHLTGVQTGEHAAVGTRQAGVGDVQVPGLTVRECQVIELVADGFTSREIGLRLHLSTRTIESHRSRLLLKLGHPTRPELVSFGRALRDTSVDA